VFKRLCLIGVGLIGGSIACAARQQRLCREIVALADVCYRPELDAACALGVIDAYYSDPETALEGADCVIIATPVGAVPAVIRLVAPYWNRHTLYSDVCSTKASVVQALETVFGCVPDNFVPAHPIAGAERSGVQAAAADLFRQRRLIITPLADTDLDAVRRISLFWERIGSKVSLMTVAHHDKVLAATSHLPHILAFALVGLLGRKDEQQEIFKYAAGGFKDFSRIASSDPTMWLDICQANKGEILPLLQQFRAELGAIEQLLQENQSQPLFDTFAYARQARQRFLDQFAD
jgi:prephenate dehydrogenase